MKKIFLFISILLTTCTKEITFDIPVNTNSIVVNGFIENGENAKILLTKSINPFNYDGNINDILSDFVNDATIIIEEKTENQTDTIESSPLGVSDTWFYNYKGNNIIGQEGKIYHLKIILNNDTITSKTTIPTSSYIENIDCIYRQNDSTYCYFLASYTDPDTIGNCISIFSKTLNSEYIIDPLDLNFDGDNYSAPFYKRVLDNGGNYNDEYINGITFTFPINNGSPDWWEDWESSDNWSENEVDSYSGPTIGFWNVNPNQKTVIKTSYMDINSWNFWASMINNNSPAIFGTPSNIQSNINGATGIWYGTSSVFDTIITSPQ